MMSGVLFSEEKILEIFNNQLKPHTFSRFSFQCILFIGDKIPHSKLAIECTYQIFSYTCVFETPIVYDFEHFMEGEEAFIQKFNDRLWNELRNFEELEEWLGD